MSEILISYHEAGHAIACIAQRIPIELLSVIPDEDRDCSGINIHSPPAVANLSGVVGYRKLERAVMLVCYAGWAAELLHDPNTEPDGHWKDFHDAYRWSVDHAIWPRHFEHAGDERYMAYLEKLKKESKKLIQKHWPAVEAIVKKLHRRKKLGAVAVYRIPEIARLMEEIDHPWRIKEGGESN